MKSISCIIPTCDRGSLLLEAVESAARQTRPPEEILIVNNGTRPVEVPAALSGRVKVHDIVAYAGVSQARNFGAAVARGDYFAFLDDDDLWDAHYLENAVTAIARGERFIVGRLDELGEEGVRPYKNAAGDLTIRSVLVRNPGTNGSNVIVERSLFHELGGFDVKLPASTDKSLVLEALLRKVPVAILPEMRVLLRSHTGARITTDPAKMAEGVWQFTRKYGRHMTTDELLHNVEKAYRHRKAAAAVRLTAPGDGRVSAARPDGLTSEERRALVLRMLRGEAPDAIACETGVAVEELTKWKRIGDRVTRLALIEAFSESVEADE